MAAVAKEQGELELAKQYAARCYKALIEGDDFLKKERLETLLKKWPKSPDRDASGLINAETGQVKSAQNRLSGYPTNEELG